MTKLRMATKYEITVRQPDIWSAKSLAALLKAVLYKVEGFGLSFLVHVDEDWDEEAEEKIPSVTVQATVIQSVDCNGYVSPFDDVREGDSNGSTET